MARPQGKKYNVGPPNVEFLRRSNASKKYWYIDGRLYRTIRVSRPHDLLRAWSYMDERVVDFVWSDAKRHMQQAFNTSEVAKLLNRTNRRILEYVAQGAINPPYKIGEQAPASNGMTFGNFKWSEDDVLALHEHLLNVGRGRPRKDGTIYAAPRLPTRLELIAMMKQNKMIYVQNDEGEFVPIFDQPDWT